MAHIREVAARAGVSVATVSRVINRNPQVKSRLREQVLAAIAELDYRPSGIARSMRSQSIRVLGLIISDIENPFFTTLVRAVEDVAHRQGYMVLLCNSDEDAEKERLYAEILSQERVAGVIVVPSAEACCRPLVEQGIPVVMVDRRVPGVQTDSVVLDNQAGGYQATKHLIGLGHRRIGLVSAPMHVSVGIERRQGYELALEEAGLPLDQSLVVEGNFKELGGYRAASALLALERRPTAIFAVNNLMTMGTLKAMHEARLRIPDDISMVGFNDMPWLPLLQPPLTAICQPTYEIGTRAAQLLFHRLHGGADLPIEAVVLKPELIVRDSTAPPPRQSPAGGAGCATGVDICCVT